MYIAYTLQQGDKCAEIQHTYHTIHPLPSQVYTNGINTSFLRKKNKYYFKGRCAVVLPLNTSFRLFIDTLTNDETEISDSKTQQCHIKYCKQQYTYLYKYL